MQGRATIKLVNNNLRVSGDLDFTSIMTIWNDSLPLLQNCSEFIFDFSEVNSVKSAGLALLVEWRKLAKRLNKPLQFKNIPPQLIAITSICNMHFITEPSA